MLNSVQNPSGIQRTFTYSPFAHGSPIILSSVGFIVRAGFRGKVTWLAGIPGPPSRDARYVMSLSLSRSLFTVTLPSCLVTQTAGRSRIQSRPSKSKTRTTQGADLGDAARS